MALFTIVTIATIVTIVTMKVTMKIERITFVWNADFSVAGGINALKEVIDGKHTCTLCEIAYHRVIQTKEWKSYKNQLAKQLSAEIRQPCRNQLSKAELAITVNDFPAVLAHTDQGVIKLLGSHQIDACHGEFEPFESKLNEAIQRVLNNDR